MAAVLPARHEPPVTFAPAEVETTVVRYGDALARGDSDALRSLVSPDFVLQEDGVTYDLATSVAAIRDALRDGAVSRHASQFRPRVMRTRSTKSRVGLSRPSARAVSMRWPAPWS